MPRGQAQWVAVRHGEVLLLYAGEVVLLGDLGGLRAEIDNQHHSLPVHTWQLPRHLTGFLGIDGSRRADLALSSPRACDGSFSPSGEALSHHGQRALIATARPDRPGAVSGAQTGRRGGPSTG